jgi:hypothetical protein
MRIKSLKQALGYNNLCVVFCFFLIKFNKFENSG